MAQGPALAREQTFVGRIVLIDKKRIGEIESDSAKRISRAWRLINADRTIGIMTDF
jgi:hypothetical protein